MLRKLGIIVVLLLFNSLIFAQSGSAANDCVSIMGDSLPAGTFVAEVPQTGVTVLQSREVSHILHDAFQARDWLHIGIYDLSLAASALADANAEPYLTSREFVLGQSLNCRAVVIFPFLNDLYAAQNGDSSATNYSIAMSSMIRDIRTNSPDSHIILMNFYLTTLQGAGEATYGDNVTANHVLAMNNTHQALCEADDAVNCLSLMSILNPIQDYVVGAISQQDYQTLRFNLVNTGDQWMLDGYWQNTPNNVIYGDGLHLNPDGQVRIIATLMQYFTTIDPINFAPILQL